MELQEAHTTAIKYGNEASADRKSALPKASRVPHLVYAGIFIWWLFKHVQQIQIDITNYINGVMTSGISSLSLFDVFFGAIAILLILGVVAFIIEKKGGK